MHLCELARARSSVFFRGSLHYFTQFRYSRSRTQRLLYEHKDPREICKTYLCWNITPYPSRAASDSDCLQIQESQPVYGKIREFPVHFRRSPDGDLGEAVLQATSRLDRQKRFWAIQARRRGNNQVTMHSFKRRLPGRRETAISATPIIFRGGSVPGRQAGRQAVRPRPFPPQGRRSPLAQLGERIIKEKNLFHRQTTKREDRRR